MRDNLDHLKKYAKPHPILRVMGEGCDGFFMIPSPVDSNRLMAVISSDGGGWDHVSVSMKGRCPNWIEMSHVKDLFFKDEETVVQYHPKKSEYVNNCGTCLHLWRNQERGHELPPTGMVGVK